MFSKTFYFFKNPEDLIIEMAVKNYPPNIKYVENQTTELKWLALKNALSYSSYIRTNIIKYIQNPTNEMILYYFKYVANDGEYIGNITNPSEEMIIYAVDKDPIAIRHIKNPSEKVQLHAVSNSKYALHYIQGNVSDKAIKLHKDKWLS